jgi:hypothetical protein
MILFLSVPMVARQTNECVMASPNKNCIPTEKQCFPRSVEVDSNTFTASLGVVGEEKETQ